MEFPTTRSRSCSKTNSAIARLSGVGHWPMPHHMGSNEPTSITEPKDCVLVFGIPTSEQEFREDLSRSDKDLARRFRTWGRYRSEVVDELVRTNRCLAPLDVQFVLGATLQD